MKLVLTCCFSLIILFGVVGGASSLCFRKMDDSISSIENQPAHFQKQSKQQNDVADRHGRDSGCDHKSTGCRSCHFGHCAFTFTSEIDVSVYDLKQVINFIKVSIIIFDFHPSPFRPPIT